jgi:hypothetical protein
VTNIVPVTWSNKDPTSLPPPRLSAKTCGSNANSARKMKTRIGTIFAMVTIRLMTAASFTPRWTR